MLTFGWILLYIGSRSGHDMFPSTCFHGYWNTLYKKLKRNARSSRKVAISIKKKVRQKVMESFFFQINVLTVRFSGPFWHAWANGSPKKIYSAYSATDQRIKKMENIWSYIISRKLQNLRICWTSASLQCIDTSAASPFAGFHSQAFSLPYPASSDPPT